MQAKLAVELGEAGTGTFVGQFSPEPDLRRTLVDLSGTDDLDTGDIDNGLDRFGRVKDNRSRSDATDADHIRCGCDRASNRFWRHNVVAAPLGRKFDEIYAYDAIHRLKDMQRGTLNTARTARTSSTFAQCWQLDSTGSWQGFHDDTDGNGSWDLIQSRTANPVNEISAITNSVGDPWTQPAYDRAGNMTTIPRGGEAGSGPGWETLGGDGWSELTTGSHYSTSANGRI